MSFKDTARAYLRDAVTSVTHAPLEVAVAIFTAFLLSYAIEGDFGEHRMEAWLQIAIAAFILFAVSWSATLLHALGALDRQQRWELTCVGAVAAFAYLLLVDSLELESEAWRALMIVAGVTLLVLAAPAWARSTQPSSLRLRRINGRFVLRAIGIGLYGLALFGGLALALAAIDKLFELDLKDSIFGHTFGWIMLVLVPWVIVGGLHSYTAPLEDESDVARVVHRLTSFLIPPLLVLYYVILFLYALRMVVTRELPKNLVSPMVLAAGLLTALAAVLFDPPPNDRRAAYRVLRFAPAIFLPLVPLALWAIFARVDEYGWTEFRLLRVLALAALFVLAALATIQLAQRRYFSLRVIPLVLGVGLLIAAVGPWSVLRIARSDQQQRLAVALREAGVSRARVASSDTVRRRVPRALYQRINDIGSYLQTHFGGEAVTAVTGEIASHWWDRWSLADYLKLAVAENDTLPSVTHGTMPSLARVPLSDGALYRIAGPSTHVRVNQALVSMTVSGETLFASLDTLIQQIPPVDRRGQRNLPSYTVSVRDNDRRERGQLVIFEMAVQRWRDSLRIMSINGVLILR